MNFREISESKTFALRNLLDWGWIKNYVKNFQPFVMDNWVC